MEMLEKVEKLREKANVSYEEAKAALEEANGDILDAMILLENQGKTVKPEKETYSTKYEDNFMAPEVVDATSEKKENKKSAGSTFTDKLKVLWKKACDNYLVLERHEEHIIKVPIWFFLLILILGIEFVPIIMVISLFFDCRYSFVGKDEMKAANDVAKKVGDLAEDVAEKVKEEYNKL